MILFDYTFINTLYPTLQFDEDGIKATLESCPKHSGLWPRDTPVVSSECGQKQAAFAIHLEEALIWDKPSTNADFGGSRP